MRPHVVIIGGGFGGLTAAKELGNADVDVTLIDRRNHHLFQPLLYQVATAGLSPADIAVPIRSILRKQKNTEVLMAEVTGINKKERLVLMKDRQIHYDYLIVATGSWHSYFGHDEWAKFAPGLKSVRDATEIRKNILLSFEAAEMETDPEKRKAFLTFVMVGAGPTGVEMSGSIAELAHQALKMDFRKIDPQSTRILLIEAGPRILASFPDELALAAQIRLEKMGVEVLTNTRVEGLNEKSVTLSGGKVLEAHTMIWCAGVVASPAGKWLETEVDRAGRVKVLEDLSIPHHPEVFVIGDTASLVQDGKPVPGVAPAAMQEGRYVASAIEAKLAGVKEYFPFIYTDKGNLATVGRSFAITDLGKFRLKGFFAWVIWLVVHIYYLIGFRNRLLVLIQWAWSYFWFERGARLITYENSD